MTTKGSRGPIKINLADVHSAPLAPPTDVWRRRNNGAALRLDARERFASVRHAPGRLRRHVWTPSVGCVRAAKKQQRERDKEKASVGAGRVARDRGRVLESERGRPGVREKSEKREKGKERTK